MHQNDMKILKNILFCSKEKNNFFLIFFKSVFKRKKKKRIKNEKDG
jgi:hypothetical protein